MSTAFPKTFLSAIGLIFSALLVTLSFFQNIGAPAGGKVPEIPDDFQPVVQFVVGSDSHNMNDRVKAMFDTSRASVANSNYTSIDVAMLAGDFTSRGEDQYIEEFYNTFTAACGDITEPLVCLGNHELMTDNVHERYTKITGWDVDRHIVVNGVHFIALSYDTDCKFGYAKQSWLRKQLDEAAADAPNMPIIVIQHPHPTATVYGSVNWGNAQLASVLDDYPQVIDFSGHSHYPINDPRSIWQGGYTALGCGGLKYYELELDLSAGHYPEEEDTAGTYWLVAIDENGSVSLRAYDVVTGGFYDNAQYYIKTPTNKSSFTYTYRNMSKADSMPTFDSDAKVTTAVNENGETVVTFTAADDKFIVHDYNIQVKKGLATKFNETVLSEYFYTNEPDTYSINVGKLDAGKQYTVAITAANAYYKLSKPLTYSFTA